ncbi:hypothetical protein ACSKF1_04870 [Lactiplantibacillus plantarum]|uniref:hypothetical protein n=1 Tax=Lactiplantibacillus plantarum TaxID=1590 RepID=UPI003854C988|nr:polysaccharide biosynthesis protein [Lactiplantibacillus plantarum]
MDIELNSRFVFKLLKRHLFLVALVGFLFAGILATLEIKMQNQNYKSSGELVQNDNNYALISSYQQFVESKSFLNLLDRRIDKGQWKKQNTKGSYSVELVNNNSGNNTNTPFFTINVLSKNKRYSKYVAHEAMMLLINNIGKYISGANISIVSNASNARRVNIFSAIKKKVVLAFLSGAGLTFIFIVVHYYCVGKIVDNKFVENVFGINNLGEMRLSDKYNEKDK